MTETYTATSLADIAAAFRKMAKAAEDNPHRTSQERLIGLARASAFFECAEMLENTRLTVAEAAP